MISLEMPLPLLVSQILALYILTVVLWKFAYDQCFQSLHLLKHNS